MHEMSSGGVSAGLKKISDKCKMIDSKMTHDYCQKIKQHLEDDLKIIETVGTKTIIKSKEIRNHG